jgi:hypothetical protein
MEARVTKLARVSARFLRSLARRRFRPSEEKVCSTEGRGRTAEALRVIAPLDDLHAQHRHRCHRSFNLPGVVAASPDQFEPWGSTCISYQDQPGPVAVRVAAEWTTTRIGRPPLSTGARAPSVQEEDARCSHPELLVYRI